MPTAIVNQTEARIRLKGERLEVSAPDENDREQILREIPIRDLDRLIISESVGVTTPAMAAILDHGIPVQVFSWTGRFLGGFLPAQNHHGLSRLRQYQRTLDPEFARDMAGRIITAKLYNQRRVLQRLNASRASEADPGDAAARALQSETDQAIRWMDALFASLRNCRSVDEIRGYEGAATARYFRAWSAFLPKNFPFERRSTRPPLNPVNACISFGSTLLTNEAVALIHAHGLDPALGTLHSTGDGRWSLALDLIEPFRPVLVEALALDLFSHSIVNESHFNSRDGGVFLNEAGRRKFFLQYERRMERQFLSECVEHRTTLRQQLEHQAVLFKAALEEPSRFEPFLMN